jgi:hypothetical protein
MKDLRVFGPRALVLAACFLILPPPARAETPPPSPDQAAVERAVRDYIDGWYEGNADRMARALP